MISTRSPIEPADLMGKRQVDKQSVLEHMSGQIAAVALEGLLCTSLSLRKTSRATTLQL